MLVNTLSFSLKIKLKKKKQIINPNKKVRICFVWVKSYLIACLLLCKTNFSDRLKITIFLVS